MQETVSNCIHTILELEENAVKNAWELSSKYTKAKAHSPPISRRGSEDNMEGK